MVDLSEGTTLKYVSKPVVNRVKCAKLDAEDIIEEVKYWQNAIVCCVLWADSPFEVIEGYVRCLWKDFAIDKVILIKQNLYLVRFVEYQAAVTVTQKGFYHNHKPLIVKARTLEMETNINAISSLPIWIQFLDLDIKCWGL